VPASMPTAQQLPVTLYDADAFVWAINIGGDAHTSNEGVLYQADNLETDAVPGRLDNVLGAQDPYVYETYREGELSLSHAIPDGVYDLTFYFVEPGHMELGERVFDVFAQGRPVIEALDIRLAKSGFSSSTLTRTVTGVVVSDGLLSIDLVGKAGVPVLSAVLARHRHEDPRAWKLVWSDEFDYQGAPDPDKWNIEVWDARRVNDEDQAYTDRSRNVRVEDGRLVLEAHLEDYDSARYTSGRIHSRGKGDWLYGRLDIRARLPRGQGTWPAVWMLPTDAFRYATRCSAQSEWQGDPDCDAWPNSGEIDIMEHVGYDMDRLHGTVHNKAYYSANRQQRKGSVEVRELDKSFHVYTLEWTPDYIRVFFEGTPYFTYYNEGEGWEAWPYDHPYYVIMNLAVGGHWGRVGGPIDDSIFPVRLEIDYVRVFEPLP